MTPYAVIHRYLYLLDQADTQTLCSVIAADADLLARWATFFGCLPRLEALRDALDAQNPEQLKQIAQAHSALQTPAHTARLSGEQWLSALRSAYLAKLLFLHAHSERSSESAESAAEDLRLLVLLAISGVQLPGDKLLSAMNRYRSADVELLEDASLELRIVAVVDATRRGSAAGVANALLGIDSATIDGFVAQAVTIADTMLNDASIDLSPHIDWERKIWLRAQVSTLVNAIDQNSGIDAFGDGVRMAGRSLFGGEIALFLAADGTLVDVPNASHRISTTSRTSRLAQVARAGQPELVQHGISTAVIDCEVLDNIGAESGLCVPVTRQRETLGVLVVAEDDGTDAAETRDLAELLAQMLEEPCALVLASANLDVGANEPDLDETLLDEFRDLEAQRLRELVHEANNPLSIVLNYLHILQLKLQNEPEALEQLDVVSSEIRRAAEIIARAREVPDSIALADTEEQAAEIAYTERASFDLRASVARTVEAHRGYAIEHGVPLNADLPDEPIVVDSHEGAVAQIVTNLLRNAIEASESGAALRLELFEMAFRDGQSGVEVAITDRAGGLPETVLRDLYAAKESDKGGEHQGLGLALCFRIAEQIGGDLDVRSKPGTGTSFSLFIPADQLG